MGDGSPMGIPGMGKGTGFGRLGMKGPPWPTWSNTPMPKSSEGGYPQTSLGRFPIGTNWGNQLGAPPNLPLNPGQVSATFRTRNEKLPPIPPPPFHFLQNFAQADLAEKFYKVQVGFAKMEVRPSTSTVIEEESGLSFGIGGKFVFLNNPDKFGFDLDYGYKYRSIPSQDAPFWSRPDPRALRP